MSTMPTALQHTQDRMDKSDVKLTYHTMLLNTLNVCIWRLGSLSSKRICEKIDYGNDGRCVNITLSSAGLLYRTDSWNNTNGKADWVNNRAWSKLIELMCNSRPWLKFVKNTQKREALGRLGRVVASNKTAFMRGVGVEECEHLMELLKECVAAYIIQAAL